MVYVIYSRFYEAKPINPDGYHIPVDHNLEGFNVARTTVDCLPPITGQEKLG